MSEYISKNDLFTEPKTTQYGSHMVMSNVYKPAKTKYINIDTKFRDDYKYMDASFVTYNQINYNVTLPDRITDVKTMTVESVEIPMSFHNISANLGNNCFKMFNNTFHDDYYTFNPSDPAAFHAAYAKKYESIIIVPDGYYTAASLVDAINVQIMTFGITNTEPDQSDLRLQLNDKNHAVFYTNQSKYTISFDVNAQGQQDKYNFKSKLGWILGFRNQSYYIDFEYNSSPPPGTGPYGQPLYTSEHAIDLNTTRYLYLAVDEYSKGNQNSFLTPTAGAFINKNILARISLDRAHYNDGTVFPANPSNGFLISDSRSYTGKIDIQKLNVQLLHESGVPMNLNGLDFSFCVKVVHE
jgi:hypothetical protein